MQNLRESSIGPSVHEDFTIRHAHLSRVTPTHLNRLCEVSDFTVSQIGGRVSDLDVESGSIYFIEDHTENKIVEDIFRKANVSEHLQHSTIAGMVSFSQADLVHLYLTSHSRPV